MFVFIFHLFVVTEWLLSKAGLWVFFFYLLQQIPKRDILHATAKYAECFHVFPMMICVCPVFVLLIYTTVPLFPLHFFTPSNGHGYRVYTTDYYWHRWRHAITDMRRSVGKMVSANMAGSSRQQEQIAPGLVSKKEKTCQQNKREVVNKSKYITIITRYESIL